jgi:hypothetical protein
MSLTITLEHADQAEQLIKAIGPLTDGERAAVSGEMARLLQRHLRTRDDRNAHQYPDGGKRSHFWRKAAESVTFGSDADSSYVSVSQLGVRLRYAGAPQGIGPSGRTSSVTGKRITKLAIPATGVAYGRTPGEFADLRLVVFKSQGKAALVQKPEEGMHLGKIMFWLVSRTKPIPADRTVLPPNQVVLGMAVMRIRQMRLRRMK